MKQELRHTSPFLKAVVGRGLLTSSRAPTIQSRQGHQCGVSKGSALRLRLTGSVVQPLVSMREFQPRSNLAFVSLDAKFGLLRGDMSFFFNRFFTGIAAPYFAYRRTFTSCFRTLLCALQRVEITTPLAPRMDLVDINCSTSPVDIPALDTFVN